MKVPASIRSGIGRKVAPCNRGTPDTWITGVPGALDAPAHGVEEGREVGDLRLEGGVLDRDVAFAECGGEEDVLGAADGGRLEGDGALDRAGAPGRERPAALVDLDAEGPERRQVAVDGARAEGAAAGHRDARLAGAGQERAHRDEAGAHAAHERVRCAAALHVAGVETKLATLPAHVDAEVLEQLELDEDVGEARHVEQDERLVAEQAREDEVQGGVLGGVDAQRAVQRTAALDVHGLRRGPSRCAPSRQPCGVTHDAHG
jgi:hypothetical protein